MTTRTVAAALIAAFASLADLVVQLLHPQPDANWQPVDRLDEALFVISLIAAVFALIGFARWLGVGRVGRIAAIVAEVGFGAMALAAAASLVAGQNVLGPLFAAGLALQLLGTLALAVAGLVRSRSRLLAPVPFVGLLLSVAVPVVGLVLLAAAWIVVAMPGLRRRDAVATA